MEEIWKDVDGLDGKYQVSNLGRIRNGRGDVLKPQKRRHGYLSVWLYSKGSRRQVSVHRLVADAFVENPQGFEEVNHKDECKQNNAADNLEWCSHRQNSSYGTRGQRIGSANINGKQSKRIAQYSMDGKLIEIFPSLHEADRRGYAAGNICRCANGDPKYSHAYGFVWKYA